MKKLFSIVALAALIPLFGTIGASNSIQAASTASASDPAFRLALAEYYAPVWHQYTDDIDYKLDYILRFNYDGEDDWNGLNNWENIDPASSVPIDLKGYVYYAVVETESHWFITYADFHPRDWKTVGGHENDMEGGMVVVKKEDNPSLYPYGSFQAMATVYHFTYFAYRLGSAQILFDFTSGEHPEVTVDPRDHGVRAYEGEGGQRVVYRYHGGNPEEPSGRSDSDVGYELLDLDELWGRKRNSETFKDEKTFVANNFTPFGIPVNFAKPPWGWPGEIFRLPAEWAQGTWSDLDGQFSLTYCYNPYHPYGPVFSCSFPPQPPEPPVTVDNATFVLGIFPNEFIQPASSTFALNWRLRNTGTSTWTTDYKLCFIGGYQMGGPDCVNMTRNVPPYHPPSEEGQVDIGASFIAPPNPGDYRGNWRMHDAQGVPFGDTVWVKVTVPGTTPATPTPTVPDDIVVRARDYPSVVTPGQQFWPAITVHLNNGELRESRGDMLRHKSGELYGAWPHVAVVGTVHAGQDYTFRFYEDNPITAPSSEGTYKSVWQVWADGRWVGPEIPIRFDVLSGGGTRPDPPTLVSPGNWHVSWDGSTPTLCASAPAGLEYYFQIYESHDTPNSGWISTNCWTPPGLGPYGYQWHVKVRDPSAGLESDWSETRHFNIISQETRFDYFYFEPPSPSAGDALNEVKIIAGVSTCMGATIRARVNTANDGSRNGEFVPEGESSGITHFESKWQALRYSNGCHLVRVEAKGCNITDWEDAIVEEQVYCLLDRPPARPELLSPDDKAWVNSRQVTFLWDPGMVGGAPPRATSYTLHVSTNSNPEDNPLLDVTVPAPQTFYTHTFDADYAALYWRTWARNNLGSWDSFSRQFGIDRQAPTSAVDDLPLTTTETKFAVSWSGQDNPTAAGTFSGIRWYDVQYRDSGRGKWTDWQLGTTLLGAIFTGQPGHTYTFRARALDNAGDQEPYPGDDGDTYTTVDPSAAPPESWWDENYASKRNMLVLNRESRGLPAGYPVHLHFDGTTSPTAAEVYAASLSTAKGDDVRIVLNNERELNRYVQKFTDTEVDIFFALESRIDPNPGSDATSYQLYAGNAAATTPANDPDAVFWPRPDANTMGLWPFDACSGSVVGDTSGRGHDGSASNMGWVSDGKFGCAGDMTANSASVNMGDLADFEFPALDRLTLEAWIYRTSRDHGDIIGKRGQTWSYQLSVGNNELGFAVNAGCGWLFGGTHIEADRWYHVAATYDRGQGAARLYVNGDLDKERTDCTAAPQTSNASLRIGKNDEPDHQAFDGYVQHVRVSNVARSSFPHGEFGKIINEPEAQAGDAVPYTPPPTDSPDLVVWSPAAYPAATGGLIIQATVVNSSTTATRNGFYIDLYSDHQPAGPGDFQNSIRYWVASPVEAGTTLTLTALITEPTALRGLTSATVAAPLAEVTATLYTQVDSTGVVSETKELNNISFGTEICLAAPDAYEPDGEAGEAIPISIGEVQTHNVHAIGDQDWITITAQSGVTYTVQTEDLGLSADTYLYLYACPEPCRRDTDGTTLLAANDDYGGSLASRLDWQAPADGTYYLLVKHWNPNVGGCGTGYDLQILDWRTLSLSLAPGWNWFSFNVSPPAKDVDSMLNAIAGDYDLLLSEQYTYAPPPADPRFNTLTALEPGIGYMIRMTQTAPDTSLLGVTGPRVLADTPLSLDRGWNWVGYLPTTSLPVTTALSSIAGKYDLVLGEEDTTYAPPPADPAHNTLAVMDPGEAYLIRMTGPATLVYPNTTTQVMAAGFSATKVTGPATCSVSRTPSFTHYYGTVTVGGQPAPAGTLVEAFNPRGEIVGCFVVGTEGRYGYMRVYGEDSTASPPIPGMREAEAVTFQVNGVPAVMGRDAAWYNDKALHRIELAVPAKVFLPFVIKR